MSKLTELIQSIAPAESAKKVFWIDDPQSICMVETGAQIRTAGAFFCGSQELEPGAGWPYDRILSALHADPAMDGRALSALIAKEFVASYPKSEVVTQSACDLAAIAGVTKAADTLGTKLAAALKKNDLALLGAVGRARDLAQGYEHPDYVDLQDFAENLAALWPAAKADVKAITTALAACVFANHAPNAKVNRSHGLSIYLPAGKRSPLYQKLVFAKGGWGKFVADFKP